MVFLHQNDRFWHSTTKTAGIVVPDGTVTQTQVVFSDINTIPSEYNECTYESNDECLMTHLKTILLETVRCKPPGVDIDLEFCVKSEDIRFGNLLITEIFDQQEEICKKPCNYLEIKSGARNFETRDTRYYAYFIPKVAVR